MYPSPNINTVNLVSSVLIPPSPNVLFQSKSQTVYCFNLNTSVYLSKRYDLIFLKNNKEQKTTTSLSHLQKFLNIIKHPVWVQIYKKS